ncbi:MAG: hypothetical protein CSA01_00025 [Bacteroidetes bacterium]|nr:MAG: hypothetical protein CSA01_00025 [Bacteroidota bacterium]
MKRIITFIVIFSMTLVGFSQSKALIQLSGQDRITVDHNSNNGFELKLDMSELELNSQATSIGNFVTLSQAQLIKTYNEGMPNIPVFSRLIEVPQGAQVVFDIVDYQEQIIELSDYDIREQIIPATRSQSKNETRVLVTKNEDVYRLNDYFNQDIARYIESGQMRDMRIGRIEISPIQYNPTANTLRVLNNLVIRVNFQQADQARTKALKQKYSNQYFKAEKSQFLNQLNYTSSKELVTQSPVHMVIVSDRMFENQLTPYIAWKEKKGFKVTVAYTDDIGTTQPDIKAYLKSIYEGDDPMTFVLFVGDVEQIPAYQASGHITDLRSCEFTGDNLPEVYYGRFSAQTTDQLQPQIDKTLMYEQYTMPDPSYLSDVLLVAGDDASHESTWGNGQIYYGHHYYFTEENNVNTAAFYQPSDNAAVHTEIINRVNAGVGFSNYTAHCSSDGWSTPSFSVSDVNGLTNANKYGLLVGNCCQSQKFEVANCFGEAILRKADGGAIGYIGATDYSYWDEDYWWGVGVTQNIVADPTYEASGAGAYDGYWHQLANQADNPASWYITQSQMVVGGNLSVEASTSSKKEYYWEIYQVMGDPTIIPYIGTPQTMNVTTSPNALVIGMSQLQVTAAPYAYVALSQNGTLIATGTANASGNVTLNFETTDLTIGDADLVITGQNKIPYINTISVVSGNEPYITLEAYSTTPNPDFGQTVQLNVTLKNVAEAGSGYDTEGVTAVISSDDSYITITENSEAFGAIAAGATQEQTNAYTFTIADNIPDQHNAEFNMTITDNNGHTWDAVFHINLNAPELSVETLSIDDSTGNNDGILDAGETADVVIAVTNEGHAAITDVIGAVSSNATAWTINTVTTSPVSIPAESTQMFTFNVTAGDDVESGTPVDLHFEISNGEDSPYTASKDFEIIIGFVPEYCAAGANKVDEYIQNVQFNTIDNTSVPGETYTDYTDISTTVVMGESYPLTITNLQSYNSDQAGCWIDWNYDGDFDDANETIAMTYQHQSSTMGVATGTVVVPEDAFTGSPVRMRLRITFGSDVNPCGSPTYGEVEDYSLNVVATSGMTEDLSDQVGLYPNPNNGTFTIKMADSFFNNTGEIEVYNTIGQCVRRMSVNTVQADVELKVTNGYYVVKITSGNNVAIKKLIVQ